MVSVSSSLLLFLFLLFLFIKWKSKQGPPPYSYPLIGCLISFYNNRHRLLQWYTDMLSLSSTHTIIISRFGARRTIVTANPKNVKYILKTNFTNYPKGKPFTDILGDFLGTGIFNVDGRMWHIQRKLLVQEFSPKLFRDYVENVLKEKVEKKLLPLLESAAADEEPIDLQDVLRRLAFDSVCKISVGFDPDCLDHDSSRPIFEAFDVASDMSARRGSASMSAAWKIKRFFNLGSEKRLREAISLIHLFLDKVISDKKRMLDIEFDLVSKMLANGKMDDEFVRDAMISFIMAGRDTTSAAMTWLFYLLSCNLDAENRVVAEIRRVRDLSAYESLQELRLLKACICESMRLFPPVAWDSKHAIRDDFLPDGTQVHAGDRVTYFPYGMGRMEKLWGEDQLDFKPERWISDMEGEKIKALRKVDPYEFPVFQAGPRECLGKEIAFLQMKYVVASILNRFRIRPLMAGSKPIFVPLLTAHMAGGFKVLVSRRK